MADTNVRHATAETSDEVAPVMNCLEAERIETHERLKHFIAPGQCFENVGRRKRNVMKVCDGIAHSTAAQFLSNQHEVVIVNPNEIIRPGHLHDHVCKFLVRLAIAFPVSRFELAPRRKTMKQRPDDLVGKSAVERSSLGRCQKYGSEWTLFCRRPFVQNFRHLRLVMRTCPANPASPTVIQQRNQRIY